MKTLIKNNKVGKIIIEEVPTPNLSKGHILVQNSFSAVSIGTEISSVDIAKKSLLEKAKSRPEDVKKVINLAKSQGVLGAYSLAMNQLSAPSSLGYSSSGVVIGIGKGVEGFKIGDRVACGGSGHSEIISVPKNLCAKIPAGVNQREASFTTIASIALQGVRQANIQLGDNVGIIGLGLIGLISSQLVSISGGKPIGIDLDKSAVEFVKENYSISAFERTEPALEEKISALTQNIGLDKIIITAGTKSNDPVKLSSKLLRDRGEVVVVGDVGLDIPRNPFYFKELSLKLSRSYGPGRYDKNYEEKGQDYPIGYVRWTENRNMQSILELLQFKKLKLDSLIGEEYDFSDAASVYERIINSKSASFGVVFRYSAEPENKTKYTISNNYKHSKTSSILRVGMIGAGNYAQGFLLPHLHKKSNVELVGLSTATGTSGKSVADKFGFKFITTNNSEILEDKNIDCVFIVTRHGDHAKLVCNALVQNKHVFVEKPLTTKRKELLKVLKAYKKSSGTLMVGYNRRFSPSIIKTKSFLKERKGPMSINYRINAGKLPEDHWIYDSESGGGRVIGEACHFVDLCNYLTCSDVVDIKVQSIPSNSYSKHIPIDNFSAILSYADGSLANISYYSSGPSTMNKEYIEIFCDNLGVVVDDFTRTRFYSKSVKNFNKFFQDKGQRNQISNYVKNILKNNNSLIPMQDLINVSEQIFLIDKRIKL